MTEIIRKAIHGYKYLFDEASDPRTKSWPFVAKPHEGVTLLILYLMFVLKWGPKLMRNRKPFNLNKILILYNGVQIICCAYVFIMGLKHAWGWGAKYRWICEPVDYSESENAMTIARICYIYFLLKIADLADTIFFVLRKKFNHLSFLHLYHHAGMVVIVWAAITYYPGGHATMVGVINSFVHCVMYTYYLLTVAVPAVKQSVTFKKLVTQIQILQFFLCIVHYGAILFKPDCGYPRWTAAVFLPQNLFMLVLFSDFYYKTYIRKRKPKEIEEKEKTTTDNVETSQTKTFQETLQFTRSSVKNKKVC